MFRFLERHGQLMQYLATISASFMVISSGINLGWTSPYLPFLQSSNSSLPTTPSEGSWCAVMPLIGAPPGAILAAILADRIGRKYTTLAITPLVAIPQLITAFAGNIWVISSARLVMGAAEGALYTVVPIYVGEISDPNIRGLLSSVISLGAICGILIINVIGPMMSIFMSSIVSLIIPVIFVLTFVSMPKSPYYLIKKQKFAEANQSLKTLRGKDDVDVEFEGICKAVARQEESPNAKVTDLFTVPSNRKACLFYLILILSNKFSGKNPVMFYTAMIFEEAGSSLDPNLSVVIICCVEFLATLCALGIVDRFGKRPLMISSAAGCSVSVFLLALHFHLQSLNLSIVEYLNWLPLAALIAYNILFSIGLAYGPVSILSELFPTNIKAIALCTGDSSSVLFGTIASKFFQITKDAFGMYVPFWCFSACSALGLLFIILYVPETKGKTLEEIQQFLIIKSANGPLEKKEEVKKSSVI